MDHFLRQKVVDCLRRDYQFKENGKYLSQGVCPSCGHKELWITKDSLYSVCCNRKNDCGFEARVRDLYPDFFKKSDFTKHPDYAVGKDGKARAYLTAARGFDADRFAHLFSQGVFFDRSANVSSATIRFQVADGVFWERIFENEDKHDRKANFVGSYAGLWWAADNFASASVVDELYVTEGIFDALALISAGKVAVSVLSAGNYPEHALQDLRDRQVKIKRLIFAFDNDKAGKAAMRRHVHRAQAEGWKALAAVPRGANDWNDLWLRGGLERLNADLFRSALFAGELLCAKTVYDYAAVLSRREEDCCFHFVFEREMYFVQMGKEYALAFEAGHDVAEALRVSKSLRNICNAHVCPVANILDPVSLEAHFIFKIDYPSRPSKVVTLPKGVLGSFQKFVETMSDLNVIFDGSKSVFSSLAKQWTRHLKEAHPIEMIGYSEKFQTYIFKDFAVRAGEVIAANEFGFFCFKDESGQEEFIAPSTRIFNEQDSLFVFQNSDEPLFDGWINEFVTAFGDKGLIVLAYFVGSLFATQLRLKYDFFPFLEIVGKPNSGKSALLKFLWKLFGRAYSYEGIPTGTFAGNSRTMMQFSNLPVVLVETDARSRSKNSFKPDEFKQIYNYGIANVRGQKTNKNETKTDKFYASLVVAQNVPLVHAEEASRQRWLSAYFDTSHHSDEGRAAAEFLADLPRSELNHFVISILKHEKAILHAVHVFYKGLWNDWRQREDLHNEDDKDSRNIKNHALICAFIGALLRVCNFPKHYADRAMVAFLNSAKDWNRALSGDIEIVENFWEAVEFLERQGDGSPMVNHAYADDMVAINFTQFSAVAARFNLRIDINQELKQALKWGKRYEFVEDSKVVRSKIYSTSPAGYPRASGTVRCMIFRKPKDETNGGGYEV